MFDLILIEVYPWSAPISRVFQQLIVAVVVSSFMTNIYSVPFYIFNNYFSQSNYFIRFLDLLGLWKLWFSYAVVLSPYVGLRALREEDFKGST